MNYESAYVIELSRECRRRVGHSWGIARNYKGSQYLMEKTYFDSKEEAELWLIQAKLEV